MATLAFRLLRYSGLCLRQRGTKAHTAVAVVASRIFSAS